ncbi:MAG: Hsp70 family protein [Planctomycetaceae bacterium]
MIHRNTTIPVSREEVFATISANQPEVLLQIYQGESRRVKDNLKLGELQVAGIPPGPAGQPVHVRFTYDSNGILEVEAYVPETGRKFRTVLTQHAQDLTEEEVAAAVARMQGLKFYPRDDVRNQRLLLFCERVIGEVSPLLRQELEEALDVFETAMSSGNRELFEHAHDGLLMTLSRLGISYGEPTSDESGSNAF